MPSKVYFPLFIHKENEGNPLNLEILNHGMVMLPSQKGQMLHFVPTLAINSMLDFLFFLVDTDSNNSGFPLPFLLIFLKHLLVVLHWILARATPCCPDINK